MLSVGEAVQHEGGLGKDGNADAHHGHDVQLLGRLGVAATQCATGFNLPLVSEGQGPEGGAGVQLTSSSMATQVISAQKMMIPMVSIRVRPTG